MDSLVKLLIKNKQCLAIMGPTASGKSALSMALAEQLPIEIISVDSALIYKGMDIGTAKPTSAEQAQVPHHLIDIRMPHESYSAADFVEDVHCLVEDVFARNHLPVLVGGTMMYFNALQKGMARLPSANETIREKLSKQFSEDALSLHKRLAEVDSEAAERIHPNDPQRLIRALEVYELTGYPLSKLQKEGQGNGLTAFKLIKVALLPSDRTQLHAQIKSRFLQMVQYGFIDEVKLLFSQTNLNPDLPSIRSVGYRQAWSFLADEYDYESFIDKAIVATRQLAKRQITWLRKEQDILILDPYQLDKTEKLAQLMQYIQLQVANKA